ncbi:MAG: BON domain-containing protein [Rhodocyclales bacterium]|nr:BON domain-containing protein [Rhodocyclales bacterium]
MNFQQDRRWLIAALAASLLTACAGNATRESTGEYIDDSVITTKVKAKFFDNPQVRATAISVETHKGVVQLSGFAASETERSRAVELARTVPGVKSVHNDIILK